MTKMTRREKSAINRAKFREQQKKRSRKSKGGKRKRKSKSGKRRRLSRKEYVARRIQTGYDYVAYKKARKKTYGPMPFELQPSWLRASKGKKYRAKRARWAKARASR